MKRVNVYLTDELYDLIKIFMKKEDCRSMNQACLQLLLEGLMKSAKKTTETVPVQ